MKVNLKIHLVLLLVLSSISFSYSQSLNKYYNEYIEKYSQLAQKQESEYGIPASIILAQGLLESSAGKSWLAQNANNHFGIKCNDWTGDKVYHSDDKKDECFRKYDNVIDSYEDHSNFLKSRSRYATLFELNKSDYEGWAHGLKQTGYATDATYAYKLISIIEDYGLHKYDLEQGVVTTDTKNQGSMGYISEYNKHKIIKNNKLKYVIANGGDTWGSIADEFNMSEKRILKFNDVQAEMKLMAGMKVYLQTKKNMASKHYPLHEVKEGESMYQIAQEYGIQLKKLYDLNNIPYTEGPKVGQVLKLRK